MPTLHIVTIKKKKISAIKISNFFILILLVGKKGKLNVLFFYYLFSNKNKSNYWLAFCFSKFIPCIKSPTKIPMLKEHTKWSLFYPFTIEIIKRKIRKEMRVFSRSSFFVSHPVTFLISGTKSHESSHENKNVFFFAFDYQAFFQTLSHLVINSSILQIFPCYSGVPNYIIHISNKKKSFEIIVKFQYLRKKKWAPPLKILKNIRYLKNMKIQFVLLSELWRNLL